ncbi:TadE/TadG family type IV pilus assembly protein [Roseovarius aestuariivivens]|uniref:TadE/TadG family type IV pilus assembly protein n=1 Tax=Roseovarius aestuariivivens TaxID=1888910 RepID=UPI001436A63E|nr:TadE/TadG family type IV pilus assembly protein [Roseovarius aestuariivivens]
MSLLSKASRSCRIFRRDTEGSASVEFVLWMPIFFGILMLVIDASILFMTQSNYWNVSRDTARLVSRHAMDATAAEAYAKARASNGWATPTAEVTITNSTVTVNLSAPARDLSVFNAIGFVLDEEIDATVIQSMEPS